VSLLQQFRRFANVYFLGIAILQSIAVISPLNPTTAILPLVFVIAVSMLREGVEDYMRFRADKGNQPPLIDLTEINLETNSQPVWIIRNGKYEKLRAEDIVVGDLVKVTEDEMFAADLILLSSSHEGGFCFI
jgi:P-type E1-E2 ATPase